MNEIDIDEKYAPDDKYKDEAREDFKAMGPVAQAMHIAKLGDKDFQAYLYGTDAADLFDIDDMDYGKRVHLVYGFIVDAIKLYRSLGIGWGDMKKLHRYAQLAMFYLEIHHYRNYSETMGAQLAAGRTGVPVLPTREEIEERRQIFENRMSDEDEARKAAGAAAAHTRQEAAKAAKGI
jgi:hypothetical protein